MDKLAILQLETNFKRIAGDICCKKTFLRNVKIIKINNASVSDIISKDQNEQHYINFKNQILLRKEDVITTSCGFTYNWQSTLNKLTKSDVITSSLCCLEEKRKVYNDDEILIFTFDEEILNFLLFSLLWNAIKNLKIKLIILECTNLSPYKRFFRNIFSGEIIDLLVLIEKKIPGIIQKEFL